MHNKTIVTFIALFLSIAGWFLWSLIIGEMYPDGMGIYLVQRAFLDNYGRTLTWWATGLLVLLTLIVVELIVGAVRRVYWPGDYDVMQRLEKSGGLDVLDVEGGEKEEDEAGDEVGVAGSVVGVREVGVGLAPEIRPPFHERSSFQGRPSFQDRPSFQERPSFQDRPSFQERHSLQVDARPSLQERTPRPSLQVDARRSSFQERRRPHDEYAPPSFMTVEEERRNPFEDGR